MEECGAEGRVLADDLLVIAEGPAHAMIFEQAFDIMHSMLADMGAKTAPKRKFIWGRFKQSKFL